MERTIRGASAGSDTPPSERVVAYLIAIVILSQYYLDGVDSAAAYLDRRRDRPFFAPSLALFEVYRGAARSNGPEGIEQVTDALGWVDPLPLDEPAVREAALVEAELLDAGERINLGDTLIAGVCRHHGARIVTRDDHFERVSGVDVDVY